MLAATASLAAVPLTAEAQQTLRLWGDPGMARALDTWEAAYIRQHPGVRFENHLLGTDTAMPALYGGLADIALLGREPTQPEHDGFLHTLQYEPLQLRLTRGALDAAGQSSALRIFVARGNPLRSITMQQLARAFGDDGRRQPARTWGDLGLTRAWKDRPLHLYTFDMESGPGAFFLTQLQGPSRKMNWAAITEFRERAPGPAQGQMSAAQMAAGDTLTAAQQALAALSRDPDGLAVADAGAPDHRIQVLPVAPIAPNAAAGAVPATRATVIDGTYPLSRSTYAFVNRPPGQPLPPAVADFLRWLLSAPAQQMLLSLQPGLLPLAPAEAAAQAAKL